MWNREHWTQNDYEKFIDELYKLQDAEYKKFNESLIPGAGETIGIRTPEIKKIAKEILRGNFQEFLNCRFGSIQEEKMLLGLVLSGEKNDYQKALKNMKRFSKIIDNWAVCDLVSFDIIKKHREMFITDVDYFLNSPNPWEIRFGLKALMQYYLDDEYIKTVLEKVDKIHNEFYYVEMMEGWLIATAFAKCRNDALNFLEHNTKSSNVINISVQKIRDSRRISNEDKELVLQFKSSQKGSKKICVEQK